MDAIVITGVSRCRQWYRIEDALGGEGRAARPLGNVRVIHAADIAALAEGGRRVYFAQADAGAPLVPLPPAQARAFDPAFLPLEEMPRFAFLEHAGEEDIDTLLALRMGEEPGHFGLRLKRLEALEWVEGNAPGSIDLSPLGLELLRHWLASAPWRVVPQAPRTPSIALRCAA